jgi:hypothetical protein
VHGKVPEKGDVIHRLTRFRGSDGNGRDKKWKASVISMPWGKRKGLISQTLRLSFKLEAELNLK